MVDSSGMLPSQYARSVTINTAPSAYLQDAKLARGFDELRHQAASEIGTFLITRINPSAVGVSTIKQLDVNNLAVNIVRYLKIYVASVGNDSHRNTVASVREVGRDLLSAIKNFMFTDFLPHQPVYFHCFIKHTFEVIKESLQKELNRLPAASHSTARLSSAQYKISAYNPSYLTQNIGSGPSRGSSLPEPGIRVLIPQVSIEQPQKSSDTHGLAPLTQVAETRNSEQVPVSASVSDSVVSAHQVFAFASNKQTIDYLSRENPMKLQDRVDGWINQQINELAAGLVQVSSHVEKQHIVKKWTEEWSALICRPSNVKPNQQEYSIIVRASGNSLNIVANALQNTMNTFTAYDASYEQKHIDSFKFMMKTVIKSLEYLAEQKMSYESPEVQPKRRRVS